LLRRSHTPLETLASEHVSYFPAHAQQNLPVPSHCTSGACMNVVSLVLATYNAGKQFGQLRKSSCVRRASGNQVCLIWIGCIHQIGQFALPQQNYRCHFTSSRLFNYSFSLCSSSFSRFTLFVVFSDFSSYYSILFSSLHLFFLLYFSFYLSPCHCLFHEHHHEFLKGKAENIFTNLHLSPFQTNLPVILVCSGTIISFKRCFNMFLISDIVCIGLSEWPRGLGHQLSSPA
jgi:hypothetical protein